MSHEGKQSEDGLRIIKKYPNRRIYDTRDSQYIKIEDIRDMVVRGENFKVLDSKTNEDVTRSVLLQIILEQESENNPLFTTDNLMSFIRYSGQAQSRLFSEYLEQSLAFFQHQQEQFTAGMQEMMNSNPMKVFADFSRQNAEMWQSMQDSFFSTTKKKSED